MRWNTAKRMTQGSRADLKRNHETLVNVELQITQIIKENFDKKSDMNVLAIATRLNWVKKY